MSTEVNKCNNKFKYHCDDINVDISVLLRDRIHKYYHHREGKEQSACEKCLDDGNSYLIPTKAFAEITFLPFQPQIYM